MTEPLKPIEFVVDNLITQGLFILAGARHMFERSKRRTRSKFQNSTRNVVVLVLGG